LSKRLSEGEGEFHLKQYPHAITKKCGSCGRIFTCKGEGWTESGEFKVTGKCPFEHSSCACEKCHHGESRAEGCEEIDLKEVVQFT
jgi:uncharacterized Fe-S center protein